VAERRELPEPTTPERAELAVPAELALLADDSAAVLPGADHASAPALMMAAAPTAPTVIGIRRTAETPFASETGPKWLRHF
jgi:hypothetical protein